MGLSCFKSWKHDSTGHKGNRDVLASPGSYFFLSNSAGQGDEWLKSLNKGVWIPFTGVFGQSLEETVLYERRYGVRLVPLVVEQCVTFIRERGLQEVGLFRQPGRASVVRELQEAFDAGERPTFDSSTDVHTVASLLKLYLRQLPEPLVPYSRYQDFLLCGRSLRSDNRTQGLAELRNLLQELPVANFNLLNFVCQFLNQVQSFSGSNKMSDQNLATVFGPNILRGKAEDPQSIMGGAALVHVLMLELIREHESLFAKVSPPTSARAHASPGGLSHLHLTPCLRQLSMPLIAGRPGEPGQSTDNHSRFYSAAANSDSFSSSWTQKRLLGHRYTSSYPENCFNPPSSSGAPPPPPPQPRSDRPDYLQHHVEQGPSSTTSLQPQDPLPRLMLMGWTKVWPSPREGDAHFWSSGAAEGGGSEGGAASGGSSEAQEEDSTPSAYDNLDRESSRPKMEEVPGELGKETNYAGNGKKGAESEEVGQRRDSSASWSSCEVLPLDESGDVVEPKTSSGKEAEEDDGGHEVDDDDEDDEDNESIHHPNSLASGLTLSPLSTGSSEVFLPSAPLPPPLPPDVCGSEPDPRSGDAASLLASLQQQMVQQRAEHQATIQRLERCNDVLERQVAALRLSLEQQRRSRSVAEIKIRNMERAKDEADRRNDSLQREMELFFQMYGEIRRRGRGGGGGRGGGSL